MAQKMNYDFVAMTWYRNREDFERIRALAPEGMDETFAAWQQRIKTEMPKYRAMGKPIKKIIIEPDEFAAWLQESKPARTHNIRAEFIRDMTMAKLKSS
jgi:hypothetical protein